MSPRANIAVQEHLPDNFNAGDIEASNVSFSLTVRRWVGGSPGHVHYTDNTRFVGGCAGAVHGF